MRGVLGRWQGWFVAAVAAMGLAVSNGAAAQALTLRFATIVPESFPYVDGMKKFKEVVEAKSNGEIKVELFHSGTLGGEKQINEGIQLGTIHMGIGAGAMASLAPIYNIVQLPFLVQGQKHMAAIADGPIGAELAKRIQQQAGFKVLAWWSTGDSAIETTKVPVKHPDDLKGLKIRVIENPALIDSLRALGASPTPMALPEVLLGLRQGVVDGAHLDAVLVNSMKAYESLKYITDWQKMTFLSEPRPVIMQAALFDKLPKRQQDAIMEAAREATILERKLFLERLTEVRKQLMAAGMTITDAPPGPFIDRVRPVWDKYAKQLNAEDLLKQIIAATPK